MRWVGKKTYKGGRLEIGHFWLTWSGWRYHQPYNIGSTRVYSVGPLSVFRNRERS